MRRVSILVLGALAAAAIGVSVVALPAGATSSVTLSSSTCSLNGPDITLNGTWNTSTSTCAVSGFAAVQSGSTLTIPSGTTLIDTSPMLQFNNDGSVVNDGAVNACYWNDFGKGVTTNAATGTFAISTLASCKSSEHEIYVGGQFQNYGAYSNSGSLVIDGYMGGATFTNFCGSTYSETGTVATSLGGTLVMASGCPQTITFTGPAMGFVGGSYTLSASATSGLPVSFALDGTSTGCSFSGPTVAFTGSGTCLIDATQLGNTTYAAATPVQVSTAVSQVSQTIMFTGPVTGLVGGSYTPSASATSGLPVSFALDGSSTGCSFSGPTVDFTGSGTCLVDATQLGNTTYAAAKPVQVSTALSSPAQPQTITFGPLANAVYHSAPFSISATSTSGLPVSFGTLTPSVCQVSGKTVTLGTLGLCTIQATQLGNGSWLAATPVNQSFNVVAVVKMCAPVGFAIERGSVMWVVFSLVDANNKPIPDSIANGANLAVTFNGGPPVGAMYVPPLRQFLALMPTSPKLAPGNYPLTITSNSPSVPINPTTISVKISKRYQGKHVR